MNLGMCSHLGGPSSAYAKAWGQYFVRFLESYEKHNVTFFGVTAQNEPAGNTGKWQDLKFSAEDQRDFLKVCRVFPRFFPRISCKECPLTHRRPRHVLAHKHTKAALGPAMRASYPEVDIIILDDQRIHLPNWADVILAVSSDNNPYHPHPHLSTHKKRARAGKRGKRQHPSCICGGGGGGDHRSRR